MLLVVLVAVLLAGCGDDGGEGPTRPVTGQTSASMPTAPAGVDGKVSPNPQAGETEGDESAIRTVVDIRLQDGGIGSTTPRTIHVAPFIAIELAFNVRDEEGYEVAVTAGDTEQSYTFKEAGNYKKTLEGLRTNRAAGVKVGADSVKVVADAQPGP